MRTSLMNYYWVKQHLSKQSREGNTLDIRSFKGPLFPPKTILQSPPTSTPCPREGSCWVVSGMQESKEGESSLPPQTQSSHIHKNKGRVTRESLAKRTLGSAGRERRLGRKTLPGIRDLTLMPVKGQKAKFLFHNFCTEPLSSATYFFSFLSF